MVDRRQWLTTAMFGGFAARPGVADTAAQSIPERQAQEIVDGLKNVSRKVRLWLRHSPYRSHRVVENIRQSGLDQEPMAQVFVDLRQFPPSPRTIENPPPLY
jgi:hypothetical protein